MSTEAEGVQPPVPDDVLSPVFRHILDAIPAALVLVDSSGLIAFMNAAAAHLFRYVGEEWRGQAIDALVPAEQRPGHPAHVASFMKGSAHRPMGAGRDLMALRRDGTVFPVEVGLSPLAMREEQWVVASVVDLSERKRLDAVIHEQHERLQAYWEAASEGLVTVSESGTIEMVNRATERIFGYDRSELVGQSLEILLPETHRLAHPQKRDQYIANPDLRAMGAGLDLFGRRKDGTQFPVDVGLNFVRVGGRTTVVGFVSDLTERRRLEDQSSALETLVDLQQKLSTDKLRRKDEASSDFDALTGLGSAALFRQVVQEASTDQKGMYVVVYCLDGVHKMGERFGARMTDRIKIFISQYVANSLRGKGDQLFQWDGTTLVALIKRDAGASLVQREFASMSEKKVECSVEERGRSAFVLVALRVSTIPLAGIPAEKIAANIDQVARGG